MLLYIGLEPLCFWLREQPVAAQKVLEDLPNDVALIEVHASYSNAGDYVEGHQDGHLEGALPQEVSMQLDDQVVNDVHYLDVKLVGCPLR